MIFRSNRLVFTLSLLGLIVSSFLLYEYNFSGSVACPIGGGCDIVRASAYSRFLGISIPILGVAFYLAMAILSVVRSQKPSERILFKMSLLAAVIGVFFGVYLTFLEGFVIKAFCFWCVLSFIISVAILLSFVLGSKTYDHRN